MSQWDGVFFKKIIFSVSMWRWFLVQPKHYTDSPRHLYCFCNVVTTVTILTQMLHLWTFMIYSFLYTLEETHNCFYLHREAHDMAAGMEKLINWNASKEGPFEWKMNFACEALYVGWAVACLHSSCALLITKTTVLHGEEKKLFLCSCEEYVMTLTFRRSWVEISSPKRLFHNQCPEHN